MLTICSVTYYCPFCLMLGSVRYLHTLWRRSTKLFTKRLSCCGGKSTCISCFSPYAICSLTYYVPFGVILILFSYLHTLWGCSTKPFTKWLSCCEGKWPCILCFYCLALPKFSPEPWFKPKPSGPNTKFSSSSGSGADWTKPPNLEAYFLPTFQYFTLPLLVHWTLMDFHQTLPFLMDSAASPSEVHWSLLDMTGFRC